VKALAFTAERAQCCPRCGTRTSEWDEDRFAYVAEGRRCMGCEVLEQARENVPADASTSGLTFHLVPNIDRDDEG
jgi:hypothetical protein